MPIPKQVLDLINTFARNIDAYKTGRYNETQVRREFIDPFFTALGWDMDNTVGYAEAYKDVIHEDAIKIGSALKAPDYCFRIGGTRKFFIEAKKPSIDIKGDPHPAFQLRRYAWSAKLGLSILTDFEEFAVYDCRIRPKKTDRASTARIKYINYTEYPDRWDEIESIFSRDAILKGSFDKYAQSTKRKKGTAEVDTAFLAEIEHWREILARNLALRNPDLTNRQLNFAVQKTIDRIIFLRIAEDRGLERYGELLALCNGGDVYARLLGLFRKADDRYNSGLFHFQREKDRPEGPDELTPALTVDDAVLKEIFKTLYYPDSPYEFSVLPAEILGHVYEQFLGKVITLTSAHRAKIEEKPEVKKAGGVYYTPAYIVDYIVENTVGKLLDSRTVKHFKTRPPRMDPPLTICDPACGSGSFLLGAYQYLLDWHLKHYTENNPNQWLKSTTPPITQTTTVGAPLAGALLNHKLTVTERKRILLDHIHGVDIDPQAVEVTKLSLLLKVLEGEKSQTLFATERALPDLANNIKCGNSLIAPDFYQNQQMLMFDEEQTLKINAFEWKTEFPQIFNTNNPGFDAVIGNPPYVRIQGFPRDQIDYFSSHYTSAIKNCDLYISFVERAYTVLSQTGLFGYILPNKFLRTDYGEGLRTFLSAHRALNRLIDFQHSQVFSATTYTCLLFLTKEPTGRIEYAHSEASQQSLDAAVFVSFPSDSLGNGIWDFLPDATRNLLTKLSAHGIRLLDIPVSMSRGSSTGADKVFLVPDDSDTIEPDLTRIPLFATDFRRYHFAPSSSQRIIFPYISEVDTPRLIAEHDLKKHFPKAYAHLRSNASALRKRKQYREWYSFSAPRNLHLHQKAQIAVPLLANSGSFAMIPPSLPGTLCPMASGGFTLHVPDDAPLSPEYLLGLLNSKLLFWRLRQASNIFRGGWITCTKQYFGELPIHLPTFTDPADKSRHDKMVSLVQTMLDLNKALQNAKTPDEKTALQRQITATDNQIDQLVYELYNLTEEEIKIVEEATK